MRRGTHGGKRITGLTTRRDVLKVVVSAPFLAKLAHAAVTLDHFPYLQDVGADHASILWSARESGTGRVEFSSDRSFSRVAAASVREFPASLTGRATGSFQYQANLSGLREGIQYFYRVSVNGEIVTPQPGSFRTAAAGPVSFVVIGDSGQGGIGQNQLASRLAQETVNFALHTGDVAYPDGTFRDFDANFFAIYKDILGQVPVFLSPGNHDYYTQSSLPYRSLFSPPVPFDIPPQDRGRYYSFDWGDIHFIALDTNDPLALPTAGRFPMLEWLERDLQQTRKFWRIAFFHHPPNPASEHHENDEVSVVVREKLAPILDKYGVPLVFCGHDHNYQRHFPIRAGQKVADGSGTQYIVTGGGGATLFPLPAASPLLARGVAQYHYLRAEANGTKVTVRALSANGAELDRYVVAPSPVLSGGGVVNAASLFAGLSPGSLISIYGQFLAAKDDSAKAFPLPGDIQGTRVTVNGQSIPLIFVSPNQINAQLPFGVSGPISLTVTSPNASATTTISVTDVAPAIFVGAVPAIIRNNGTVITSDSPALQGEFVSIFLTGMGSVNGSITAGQQVPNTPFYSAVGLVEVLLGTDNLVPAFAGLAPGFAGVYQVVVQVPASLASGVYGLQVMARGAGSNQVSIPVGFPALPPPPPDPFQASIYGAAEGFATLFDQFLIQPADIKELAG